MRPSDLSKGSQLSSGEQPEPRLQGCGNSRRQSCRALCKGSRWPPTAQETVGSPFTTLSAPTTGPGKLQPQTHDTELNAGSTTISTAPFSRPALPISFLPDSGTSHLHAPTWAVPAAELPSPLSHSSKSQPGSKARPKCHLFHRHVLQLPFAYDYNNNWGMS